MKLFLYSTIYSAPSHYLEQGCLNVNWTSRNKFQGNMILNIKPFCLWDHIYILDISLLIHIYIYMKRETDRFHALSELVMA